MKFLDSMLTYFRTLFHNYSWWIILLALIGAGALISLLIVVFLPIGKGPSAFTTTTSVPPSSSSNFSNMLSETLVLPLEHGQDIELLNNGDEFLPAVLADIDNAHSTVDFMVYTWEEGSMSDQIFSHLNKKLKEGVAVRIMFDSYGSKGSQGSLFAEYKKLGGQVTVFHPAKIFPWALSHNQVRNHRRAIVIDGKIGYTGGIAVSDTWLGHAQDPDHWRDMMFRTTGSMARDIQGVFAELWASNTGELLIGPDFFPETSSVPGTLSFIPLASTPSPSSLQLQKFIVLSILGAQKKIYITSPYFLPDGSLSDALIKKAREGVDVRILVPNKFNDSQGVRYASQFQYQGLMDAGVKIYEYQPTFIHTKSIVIDGGWSIIGSANMDNRSRKINEEDIFGISSSAFGAKLEATFLTDLSHSEQIDPIAWKNRGLWQRAREVFARKFVQQY